MRTLIDAIFATFWKASDVVFTTVVVIAVLRFMEVIPNA